jgi:hypothetical protein
MSQSIESSLLRLGSYSRVRGLIFRGHTKKSTLTFFVTWTRLVREWSLCNGSPEESCEANMEELKRCQELLLDRRGQNLALTVLCVCAILA